MDDMIFIAKVIPEQTTKKVFSRFWNSIMIRSVIYKLSVLEKKFPATEMMSALSSMVNLKDQVLLILFRGVVYKQVFA